MFSFFKAKIPVQKKQDQYKIIERLNTKGEIFYTIEFTLGEFDDPFKAYAHKLGISHYLRSKVGFVGIQQAEAHIEWVKQQIEYQKHRKIVKVV